MAARAATDLFDENKVWSTGWRQLRAQSDAEFRDAVEEVAALNARDEFFAKHITPEPAEVRRYRPWQKSQTMTTMPTNLS